MKSTPITEKHRALGAKMVDFAGYEMPLQYAGVSVEHLAVRNHAGIFDVSHMGEFVVRGKEALDLVQYVTSNDASKLEIGQAQYSCLPNTEGGIVDDLLVYRLPEDQCDEGEKSFLLVVNASNIEKDFDWISQHNTFDAKVINISSRTGLLAIQGPKAIEILQAHTEVDLKAIKYYRFEKGVFADCPNILISATGYTGAGGFELYGENDGILKIWDALLSQDGTGLVPVGLAARDTLRLEMGYCLYGNDITDSTSPLEAGLGWITKLKKGAFIGRELLQEQKGQGVVRKLVALTIKDKRVPRSGYEILTPALEKVGHITSGTFSPSLSIPIGLGYVKTEYSSVGTELLISTGRKEFGASVTKLPFLKT